jgi:hypothetical protein
MKNIRTECCENGTREPHLVTKTEQRLPGRVIRIRASMSPSLRLSSVVVVRRFGTASPGHTMTFSFGCCSVVLPQSLALTGQCGPYKVILRASLIAPPSVEYTIRMVGFYSYAK